MKRYVIPFLIAATPFILCIDGSFARGPGGGSRGGGGGGRPSGGGGAVSRPAPAAGRSPSLGGGSAAPRGAQPGGARPGGVGQPGPGTAGRPGGNVAGRPSAGQLNDFLDVPKAGTGAVGTRPANAAGDFLQSNAGGRVGPGTGKLPGIGDGAGRPAVAAKAAGTRPARVENRQELQSNRQARRDEIRNQVKENNPRLDFWSDHSNWAAWRINRPYRWATWALITGWVGNGWTDESSYAYGENIYYGDDGQVYYGDQAAGSAEEYAQQADAIAASAPKDVKPENADWLPLGVFAVTQDGQASGADPTLFMQLAISKEGMISGHLKNTATGQTQTLEGMADKETQRVAWGVTGQQRPIVETGISNLTKDTSPVLVHFADGQTQQWLLVRLPEPAM